MLHVSWCELYQERASSYTKGDNKYGLPLACYKLTSSEKSRFIEVLKRFKVLDGYESNRSVTVKNRKITRLKSYDCHVVKQLLLIDVSLSEKVMSVAIDISRFLEIYVGRKTTRSIMNVQGGTPYLTLERKWFFHIVLYNGASYNCTLGQRD